MADYVILPTAHAAKSRSRDWATQSLHTFCPGLRHGEDIPVSFYEMLTQHGKQQLPVISSRSTDVETECQGLLSTVGEHLESHWTVTARRKLCIPTSKVLPRHDLLASLGA